MGIRDLLIRGTVYLSLPVIPFRPFVGILMYSWLAYMRPQDLAWGLRHERFSFLVFAATAVGLAIGVVMGREKPITIGAPIVLMGLLWGWFFFASQMAFLPELTGKKFSLLTTVVLVALITTSLVRNASRFRALMLLIAFSLGALGAKYGVYGVLRGGARFDSGPGGFMVDNNTFATALNCVIPLLAAVFLSERSRWLKIVAVVLAVLSMMAIVFTFSRGGLLTLGVVGALIIVRSKKPGLAAILLVLGGTAFLLFTSEDLKQSYFGRATTITSYEEDASAAGRIEQWQRALRIAADRPWTGVGPGNLEAVYRRYAPGADHFLVTHNSYLQFVVEAGIPALVLFLAMIAICLWQLERVRKDPPAPWIGIYASMMQLSFVAFCLGGMLLDMAYFDLIYHLVALTVCLRFIASRTTGSEEVEGAAGDDVPWWKRPRQPRPAVAKGTT